MGLRTRTACCASSRLVVRPNYPTKTLSATHTGRRNAKRTLENISGGDVELSSEELSEIDRVLSSHAVKGGRYVDTVSDEKLHLWG